MSEKFELHSSIWREEAQPENPFVADRCLAFGYDVYGDILKKSSWAEYLLLLFFGERPSIAAASLLEKLAIALANPGPREPSVRAAMNGGVGGSVDAASLIAALAVGAGQYGGSHEVYLLVDAWCRLGEDLEGWKAYLSEPNRDYREDVWSPIEHPPGFDPHGVRCARPVVQSLDVLTEISPGSNLTWLQEHRSELERHSGLPLAMSAVAAAAFHDLGFSANQAIMMYLMLRLPGAAVHALEQEKLGWKKFPAYGPAIHLNDDPGPMGTPDVSRFGL